MESREQVSRAYSAFAPAYDAFFGAVLEPGRRAAIREMNLQPGARVLEVGIGTGLALSAYPRGVRITGVDLSLEMLERARRRAGGMELARVVDLKVMDARALDYPNASFDAVVAMYVVSVTPEPERVIAEMRRVCRPGGQLVIVNHFRTTSRTVRITEKLLRPLHRMVNYSAELDYDAFVQKTGLEVIRCSRANILGYSTVVHCRARSATPQRSVSGSLNERLDSCTSPGCWGGPGSKLPESLEADVVA
ncbi:MAG: class I SAM-dependent methyltransferase, partial [Pseudomonadota bacterium]